MLFEYTLKYLALVDTSNVMSSLFSSIWLVRFLISEEKSSSDNSEKSKETKKSSKDE